GKALNTRANTCGSLLSRQPTSKLRWSRFHRGPRVRNQASNPQRVRKEKRMGVAVREKQKDSGVYWLFIRHAGERGSQMVGDKETAEDAKKEILREIRLGRFDIAAMKAARMKEKDEKTPIVPTLAKFFDETMSPLWEASLAKATYSRYELSFRLHIKPV